MRTVLIADDSMFMRTLLKNKVQEHEYFVIAEAADGKEAISQFKKYEPDIVLLDITMPNIGGMTALKEIMKIDSNAKVVMCSALATKSNIIEALNEGAKDFVVKPHFHKLVAMLDNIFD